MAETVQKQNLDLDNMENFETGKDRFAFFDHFSKFSGLAVAQLYLICAAVTGYEVISRYVFDAPTQWVFEVVMVLAATAWMLSAAYVTLHKRHIGITVFYIMASDRGKWWLDLIAYVVGIIALWLLIDDSVIRALDSVMMLEKAGSAWNSPQPMILKSMLTIGATTYIIQLMINLYRHFSSNVAKKIVLGICGLIILRITCVIIVHFIGEESFAGYINSIYAAVGSHINPQDYLNMQDMNIGTASILIVVLMLVLMMTQDSRQSSSLRLLVSFRWLEHMLRQSYSLHS